MTANRPTPSASWSSGTTRSRGKHSTLPIHSWLPHGALNGSNGWTHNLEARELRENSLSTAPFAVCAEIKDADHTLGFDEVYMPRLLSVNVGLPRDVTWNGKSVRTSVWKSPVDGPRMVRKLDIDGDAQADLAGHGGEHRAVFVYQMDSYHYWERFLGRSDFTFGQFGENFTVEGIPDNEACIGDRYRIGDAEFEVTQPRVTCYRVGIRMNEPRMAALLVAHHRPGFYFRVLQEGEVGAGDDIVKIADGPERSSVADVDALLYLPGHSSEQLQRALRIPALSKGWQS